MIRHIIFDCDGVLLDTEIVAAEVMAQWLTKKGHEISPEEYIRTHTGKTFSGIISELQSLQLLPNNLDTRADLGQIEHEVVGNIRLINGLEEALLNLKLPKSVVSNSSVSYVKQALTSFDIAHNFEERIFSSEMVEAPKPSPMVYLHAIDAIGIPKENLLVVEDSLTGVQAAVNAGLTVVGFLGGSHILPGHGERLIAAGASEIVEDHGSLAFLLEDSKFHG